MNITQEAIENAIELCGAEIEPRYDYSGRGMFGATCFGIVCDLVGYTAFVGYLTGSRAENPDWEDDWQDIATALTAVQVDNMGSSTIFYFRQVTVTALH
jgi:hypothetical protein